MRSDEMATLLRPPVPSGDLTGLELPKLLSPGAPVLRIEHPMDSEWFGPESERSRAA